ncbi:MAG TPA: hypothetical protein VGE07_22265 [Herpetosiphonaceae bacterium]
MFATLIIACVVLSVLALLPYDRTAAEDDEAAEEPSRLRLKPTRQR